MPSFSSPSQFARSDPYSPDNIVSPPKPTPKTTQEGHSKPQRSSPSVRRAFASSPLSTVSTNVRSSRKRPRNTSEDDGFQVARKRRVLQLGKSPDAQGHSRHLSAAAGSDASRESEEDSGVFGEAQEDGGRRDKEIVVLPVHDDSGFHDAPEAIEDKGDDPSAAAERDVEAAPVDRSSRLSSPSAVSVPPERGPSVATAPIESSEEDAIAGKDKPQPSPASTAQHSPHRNTPTVTDDVGLQPLDEVRVSTGAPPAEPARGQPVVFASILDEDDGDETDARSDASEHEVSHIGAHRPAADGSDAVELLVHWAAGGQPTWELEEQMQHGAREAVAEYWNGVEGGRLSVRPYEVFAIRGHEWVKKKGNLAGRNRMPSRKGKAPQSRATLHLRIEWLGYTEETLEPAARFAKDQPRLVQRYFELLGGEPERP
ncbi:hypothetical protein VTK73DRAFT_802 [Phialemonium thermophilum]|uniref:Chromo domain-containing protein n=1 Tax=Phialemonium thermophilum TaxID=223376 RepID=A0ABR3XD77_9PEZI